MRGSTWWTTVLTARNCCSMGVHQVSVPSELGPKSEGHSLCYNIWSMPFKGTSNPNWGSAQKVPRALTYLLAFLPSQRQLVALISSPTYALHLFHILKGWTGFHLFNHSFWYNALLTWPTDFQTVPGPWTFYGFTNHPFPRRCSRKICSILQQKDVVSC